MKRIKTAKLIRRQIFALGEAGILEPGQMEAAEKSLGKVLTSVKRCRDRRALYASLDEFLGHLIRESE